MYILFHSLLVLQDGFTALYMATQNHHVKVVELLIEAGADVNQSIFEVRSLTIYKLVFVPL